jgi:outer membrane protein TolC
MRVTDTLVVATLAIALLSPVHASGQMLPRVDGPLTVDRAVDLTIQHSLRLKAAAADARIMDSMRREALAPFWPQLSANGYLNEQRQAPNVYTSAGDTMARNYQVFDADRNRDANITLMWPLFSGGRDYYGYRAATRRAEAGREMQRASEVDVAMQARLDYVAAVREEENSKVSDDLVRDVEERVRVSRTAFDAGRIPRYYLLRDETELANARQMQAMARARAGQALIALKTTLGVALDSDVTLADRLDLPAMEVPVDELLQPTNDRHPEVRAATKQREAAEAEVRAAQGRYLPQLSASYMYDWAWMKNRSRDAMADGSEGYSVGLVLTLPIFDGFMRENAINTARARIDRAAQAEALARQEIAKELQSAALMVDAARRSVQAARMGVAQATEEARAVRERFESGRGIQLEVLDAQVAITRARLNEVTALADYQSAYAMWLRAAGRVR